MRDAQTDDEFFYRTEARFNAIYVLESLGPRELKTGEALFDSVVYPATTRLEGLYANFASVWDEHALLRKLAEIAHAARVANHLPILHIEAHGGPDGIELADGKYVTWRTLIPFLVEINKACRNNLIVVAISCQGWNLTASLMPADRAPVFMLVGPPDNMTAGDLLAGTRRFYEALIAHLHVNKALEAMNSDAPFPDWELRPATAEILFCRVFREYVANAATPEALKARENELVADVTRARGLSVVQSGILRVAVRADLADHRAAYDRLRRKFLMLDLFPDDVRRFGLTYDLCMPGDQKTRS